jgi:hypothetical protein
LQLRAKRTLRKKGKEALVFCSQCGSKADGRFCSRCGAPLNGSARTSEFSIDWSESIDYEELLKVSEVRDLIAQHAARAEKRISAEEFLSLCDNAFSPIKGLSSKTVTAIVQPVLSALGVKTGKSRSRAFRRPAGEFLVAALCSLARHGWPLRQVNQGRDGCVLAATLPSDVYSCAATVVISISRTRNGTLVEAAATVPGQLYDWGKSKRCLDELFADLESTLSIVKRHAG